MTLMALSLISCQNKPNEVAISNANTGWLVNQCFAIQDVDLKPGAEITARIQVG